MNIIEVIKANKKVILKRGLIALGITTGLTMATKVLFANSTDEDDFVDVEIEECDEDTDE